VDVDHWPVFAGHRDRSRHGQGRMKILQLIVLIALIVGMAKR
jgi:hypothetical protein